MNPKIAQTLYIGGTVVTGIISIAAIWGGLSADTAAGIIQALTGLLTLLGGTAITTTAAVRTTRQRQDGTLGTPVDQILSGLDKLNGAKATGTAIAEQATADLDKVTQAVTGALGQVPVIGPTVGALTQQVIDATRPR